MAVFFFYSRHSNDTNELHLKYSNGTNSQINPKFGDVLFSMFEFFLTAIIPFVDYMEMLPKMHQTLFLYQL